MSFVSEKLFEHAEVQFEDRGDVVEIGLDCPQQAAKS